MHGIGLAYLHITCYQLWKYHYLVATIKSGDLVNLSIACLVNIVFIITYPKNCSEGCLHRAVLPHVLHSWPRSLVSSFCHGNPWIWQRLCLGISRLFFQRIALALIAVESDAKKATRRRWWRKLWAVMRTLPRNLVHPNPCRTKRSDGFEDTALPALVHADEGME